MLTFVPVQRGVLRSAAKTGNWSSRFKGVTWNKKVSKWQARVGSGDTRKNLGFFKCEREASILYNVHSHHIILKLP